MNSLAIFRCCFTSRTRHAARRVPARTAAGETILDSAPRPAQNNVHRAIDEQPGPHCRAGCFRGTTEMDSGKLRRLASPALKPFYLKLSTSTLTGFDRIWWTRRARIRRDAPPRGFAWRIQPEEIERLHTHNWICLNKLPTSEAGAFGLQQCSLEPKKTTKS